MIPDMKFCLEDDPLKYYHAMLKDIEEARDYVFVEMYKFGNDTIGIKFRDALAKKAKQGVMVKILVDSWGGSALSDTFFHDIVKNGGEVRFFEKIRFNTDFFTRSHRRNHRKLLIIDDHITYIGSSNFTEYNLNWREMVLRMDDEITTLFKEIFFESFDSYNKYLINKARYSRTIKYHDFEIIRDVPSIPLQRIKKRFERLIRSARKSVVIETPYFLPGFLLRKAMIDAAKRGVEVNVILPRHSDVRLVDILRNKYLGILFKNNIKFLYYKPGNLHAKMMFVDGKVFAIGSPNFDYRSFRYLYEIILVGKDPSIAQQLQEHIRLTIEESEDFDYEKYLDRPTIEKIVEWMLLPFRHLL